LPIEEVARLISIKVINTMSAEYALQGLRENKGEIAGTERGTIESGAGHRGIAADQESEEESEDTE
jgi:hypothetical protein